MSDNGQPPDSQLPPVDPWPTLAPEWRLRVTTASGHHIDVPHASEEDAQADARHFKAVTWVVQKRMVTEWVPAGPTWRNRLVVEQVEADPATAAEDCSYRGATPPGVPPTQEG